MGGKGGHMLHPYEDPEIVFQSLEDLFEHVALNGLEGTIKRDGQNLVVSYSLAREQAVAIRNDDHVFVKGMGLDGEGPTENFADYLAHSQKDWKRLRDGGNRNKKATPPHIVKAFSKALEELELVARSLPQKTALELFGEDADIFYNAEVMSPISRNAIEYDVDTLSIHRILHHLYDEEKRELDTLGAADSNVRADALNKALEDYYRNTDTTYDPRDPKLTPGVSVGAMEHLAELADAGVAEAAISDLRQYYTSYGMSASDTLGRLVFKVFRDAVDQLPSIGPDAQKKLVTRMFQEVYTKDVYSEIDNEESVWHDFGPRTSRLTEGKIHIKEILKLSLDQDPMTLKSIGDLKDEAKPLHLQAITPLVNILFEFSSHALGALRDLYVLNRDAEIERTRDDVLKTIANLAKSLDPINSSDAKAEEKWKKFLLQRDKFEALEDKISEAEGFVFQWPPGSDNTYKFTGLFAPINQLLGMDPSRWEQAEPVTEAIEVPEPLANNEQIPTVGPRIVLFPGSFKPPHRGHLSIVNKLLPENDEVRIFVSDPKKSVRTVGASKKLSASDVISLWEQYVSGLNGTVMVGPGAVKESIDFIAAPESEGGPPEGATIALACGAKGNDAERFSSFAASARSDLTLVEQECPLSDKHDSTYMEQLEKNVRIKERMPSVIGSKDPADFHASDFRYLLGLVVDEGDEAAFEMVKDFVPEGVDVSSIIEMLDDVKAPVAEIKKKLSMDYLYSLVEETLDEISGMGGSAGGGLGAASGVPGPVGPSYKRDKKKKKLKKKKPSKPRKTEVNEVSEEELDEGLFDFVTREKSSESVYDQAKLLKTMYLLPQEKFAEEPPRDRELLAALLGWKLPVSLEIIAAEEGRTLVPELDASVDWDTIRSLMKNIQKEILDTGKPVSLPAGMTSYKRDTKKKRS